MKNKTIIILTVIFSIILCITLSISAWKLTNKFAKDYYGYINNETFQQRDEAEQKNQEGMDLMDLDRTEEAIKCFEESAEIAEESLSKAKTEVEKEDLSAILTNVYNNLCWAYNILEQYQVGLEYGREAINIQPNDFYEYINYGNSLSGLGNNEEALRYYDMAIEDNADAQNAYYGKGAIYYLRYQYKEAIEMFVTYLEIEPNDLDAISYLIEAYYNNGEYKKALELVNKAIENNNQNVDLYIRKGRIVCELETIQAAIQFYEEILERYPDHMLLMQSIGDLYYNHSNYQEALDHYIRLAMRQPDNENVNSSIINCYVALENFDQAKEFYESCIDNNYESALLCNTMGDVYYNQGKYMESIEYYDIAIQLAQEDSLGYSNKLYALLYAKRYYSGVNFAKLAANKYNFSYDILFAAGECFYNLGEYESAILYYKKILVFDPKNDKILSYIGDAYLMLEDYKQAEEYANQALEINSKNDTAINVLDRLESRTKPIGEQLNQFIKNNYLYYDTGNATETVIDQLFPKEDMTNEEIMQALEQVKKEDDIFSFVLSDEEYDYYYSSSEEDVKFDEREDIIYLRITGFNFNTDQKVIEGLDAIQNPKAKTLVIDLRGNSGGMTTAANNILDVLLPDRATCSLIYRDGYNYNYYSDNSRIEFKRIDILVDEYSASASELLTLGLKTYLSNVTIMGRDTFGKGVGQLVFEDKERKLILFLVNHYWNVREQNIMNTSISPDIYVNSEDLEEYLKIIEAQK